MLRSLSGGQRDMLTVGTLLAPVLGLAYMAAGSDGAFVRAGKRGAVVGLAGACGLSALGFLSAKTDSEALDNVMGGGLFGGLGGLAVGVIGSFGYDALQASSG